MRRYWLLFVLLGAATCTKEQVIPCTKSTGCPVTAAGAAPLLCDQQTGDKNDGLCVTCDQTMTPNGEAGACSTTSNGAAPFCDKATKTCRACQQDSECPDSQVCSTADRAVLNLSVPTGQCVPAAQVAYASSDAELQTALSKNLPYVVLVPGTYSALSLTSGNVVIIGPGQDLTQAATIKGVSVSETASVALDEVTINGGSTCNGPGASLVLLRSAVFQSPGDGVTSQSCQKLTIERSRISLSLGAAVTIGPATASYSIRNSALYGNQGTTAVTLNSTDGFFFNTVADNAGGIDCHGRAMTNSIVVRNGTTAGSQFSGCTLTDMVVGTGDSAAGTRLRAVVPDFNTAGSLASQYQLLNDATNMACCIDQLNPMTGFPPNDYFGTSRPQPAGGKYDIGFHEVKQ